MFIRELFHGDRPVFSVEIFPPKPDYPIEGIYRTLDTLHTLHPDFISVTYGAGGSNRGRTVEIAQTIRSTYGMEALAHLTCIGHSQTELTAILETMSQASLANILALRGDPPQQTDIIPRASGDFRYADELITFIKKRSSFCLGAAAYPEGHPQSASLQDDTDRLKWKADQGADFLITQLFLDNCCFFDFLERIRKAGIQLPVSAGIMPVLNRNIQRIIELSHARVPERLLAMIRRYDDRPEELEKAGIEYAVEQINELLSAGVDGIHLYSMNKADQSCLIAKETHLAKDRLP